MPLALFVFVGPHSVIRLLNAPRPSSFPPPQPRSTATGGDGDRCGEIQRAVNHRRARVFSDTFLPIVLVSFRRSPSSPSSPLSASVGSHPLPTPFSPSRFARPVFPPFFPLLFCGAASMRLCQEAKKERKNEETALYRSRERYDGCRESSGLETRAARFIRETELIEPDARTSEKKEERGVRREEAVRESRSLMVPVERGRPCCRNRIIGRFVRRRADKVGRR